jgi:hypothetical protein
MLVQLTRNQSMEKALLSRNHSEDVDLEKVGPVNSSTQRSVTDSPAVGYS